MLHVLSFRSGTYYYKPDNRNSCCPHYTIRYVGIHPLQCSMLTMVASLDASLFDSRRDQRQAINRWTRYVLGINYTQKAARFCPRTREYAILRATCLIFGKTSEVRVTPSKSLLLTPGDPILGKREVGKTISMFVRQCTNQSISV